MPEERKLSDWIEGYLQYTDFNKEPPLMYKTWVAISTIASALQRKVYLPWEKYIYPNMYIVLIGPPGHRKGSAMYPAESLLRELGYVHLASEATTRENLIRELKNSGFMTVDAVTQDQYHHASLTIHSAELTVFLGYKNTVLMSDLCDWYDCRDKWRYRTKHQGEDNITGVFVNLLGATTPELLTATMNVDAIGSGLPSRIIFVFENQKGEPTPDAFIGEKEARIKQLLLQDLEKIYLMSGSFKLHKQYLDKYTEWYLRQTSSAPCIEDARFSGYCERRATHLRKLSMILCASRTSDMILTQYDFDRALDLLIKTEERMPLTFLSLGRSAQAQVINEVVMFMSSVDSVSAAELFRHFYRDVDVRTFSQVITQLMEMGVIDRFSNTRNETFFKFKPPKEGENRGMFDLQVKPERRRK